MTMEFAVLKSGGKQYKISPGDILEFERLNGEKNDKISFNEILLYVSGDEIKVGTPFLNGASVSAVILEHFRGDKIRVAKFKAKTRYRRVTGHRQDLTRVKIGDIKLAVKKSQKEEK